MHSTFRLLLFRLIILLSLATFFTNCSPAHQLARRYNVNKRVLQERLITTDKAGETQIRWRADGLFARRITLAEHKTDTAEFNRIKALTPKTFYGPFVERDTMVYYLWKSGSEQVPFANFIIAQFHQRFGIGDELFQERLDNIMVTSIAAEDPKQSLEDFPDDDEIGVGMVLGFEEEKLDDLKPKAIEFLKGAAALEFQQSGKTKFSNTTITEVLIKTKPLVYYEHLHYVKILVRKPLKPLK